MAVSQILTKTTQYNTVRIQSLVHHLIISDRIFNNFLPTAGTKIPPRIHDISSEKFDFFSVEGCFPTPQTYPVGIATSSQHPTHCRRTFWIRRASIPNQLYATATTHGSTFCERLFTAASTGCAQRLRRTWRLAIV